MPKFVLVVFDIDRKTWVCRRTKVVNGDIKKGGKALVRWGKRVALPAKVLMMSDDMQLLKRKQQQMCHAVKRRADNDFATNENKKQKQLEPPRSQLTRSVIATKTQEGHLLTGKNPPRSKTSASSIAYQPLTSNSVMVYSTQPSTQSTQLTHKPSTQSTQPTQKPSTQSTQPTQKPSTQSRQLKQKPSTQSTQPTQKPSTQSTQPTQEPSIQSTQPTQKPSIQSTQPTQKRSTQSTQPKQKPSTQSTQPTQKPSTQSTQPKQKPSIQSTQPTQKPSIQSTQPTQKSSTQSTQPTQKPSTQSTHPTQKPSTYSTQPTQKPSTYSTQPTQKPYSQSSLAIPQQPRLHQPPLRGSRPVKSSPIAQPRQLSSATFVTTIAQSNATGKRPFDWYKAPPTTTSFANSTSALMSNIKAYIDEKINILQNDLFKMIDNEVSTAILASRLGSVPTSEIEAPSTAKPLSTEDVDYVFNESRNLGQFAKKLVFQLYTPEDRVGRNCRGVVFTKGLTRKPLSPRRLHFIKKRCCEKSSAKCQLEFEKIWKEQCVKSIDRGLRGERTVNKRKEERIKPETITIE
ncbi:uncharacterized protein LOC102807745 [Saccoglossus kowalevskii]|uniref:Endochitinase 2-like n=1 Tax=Saccoglossus kowalevskii TaxID=10224 RepID=A0ABM0LVZ6_SACKO|nr:PREDICTED: endochitinase 2-like [Saccoglossus kowalevskii]